MIAPNEFWLEVHRLARAYEGEGLSAADRHEQIVAEFRAMPTTAQHEVLAALLRLAVHVPAIYSLVVADMRKARHQATQSDRAIQRHVA